MSRIGSRPAPDEVPDIDTAKARCSLVLVTPRKTFLDWLEGERAGDQPMKDLYFPEENGAWIVPPISAFGSEAKWARFLESLKSKLLRSELGRFPGAIDTFPHPCDAGAFDQFFTLETRDKLIDIRLL